ncbi:MAG: hypothetical protein JWP19_2428 [Rhodoglobus sp.]|nr:hypothetical protein [Rhodoglobus sp.]
MTSPTLHRAMTLLPLALAALALAGCTAAPPAPNSTASNDAEAAKFVACLTAQGQTAKILDSGQVGLLLPDGVGLDAGPGKGPTTSGGGGGGDAGPSTIMVMQDADGSWMAANSADGYPSEGGMGDAWTACETEVPDFTQPDPKIDGADIRTITKDDVVKASLAFAKCARDNSYADFADPDSEGMLSFPLGMTEDEFRSLLQACSDSLGDVGLPIAPASADSFDFDWMSILQEFGNGKNMVSGGSVSGTGPESGSN